MVTLVVSSERAEGELQSRACRLGEWLVQPSLNRATRADETVQLEPKLMDVLVFLAERAGRVVSREEIIDAVWARKFIAESVLRRAIAELRSALHDDAQSPRIIDTIAKRGYRLIADVVWVDATGPPEAASTAPTRTRRLAWAGLVGALAVLAGAAVMLRGISGPQPAGTAHPVSVVVLPLQNLSSDPEQEYFADGMTDALTANLAQIGGLQVISRTSALHFKRSTKDLPEIARELHADVVVEGSVAFSAGRVRVIAQLIEAAGDRHLWAKTFERDLTDILRLQGDIARAVAAGVRVHLEPREQARLNVAHAVDPEAYEAYLRGLYDCSKTAQGAINQGIEELERSIRIAPAEAAPYAALADCYGALSEMYLPPKEVMPKAKAAAMRALELDSTLASAHTSLALINTLYEWDWVGAEREFTAALDLDPSSALTHAWYGLYLAINAQPDAAVAEAKRAVELDPLSLDANRNLGKVYNLAGQYAEAVRQLRVRIAMDPSPGAGYSHLGSAYLEQGMYTEALAEFQKISSYPGGLEGLGETYARMGRREEAERVLAALTQQAKQQFVSRVLIAELCTVLGRKDEALDLLEKAYDERDEALISLLVDPSFRSLRSEPRYTRLLKRMGLGQPPV